jgi:hypothetical protein
MIQLGDYVAQMHPKETFPLKKGIVVESLSNSYTVHWTSYNKKFFMELEGEAFEELNSRYLLTKMSYSRTSYNVDIVALSKAG